MFWPFKTKEIKVPISNKEKVKKLEIRLAALLSKDEDLTWLVNNSSKLNGVFINKWISTREEIAKVRKEMEHLKDW